MAEPDVRPRAGHITRHDTGAVEPVRYVPTSEPGEFLPVTPDGERIRWRPGDVLHVDVLAPGQSVVVDVRRPGRRR